jgi:hypothetical protein
MKSWVRPRVWPMVVPSYNPTHQILLGLYISGYKPGSDPGFGDPMPNTAYQRLCEARVLLGLTNSVLHTCLDPARHYYGLNFQKFEVRQYPHDARDRSDQNRNKETPR